ncbi:MAG: BlaI/MecI/CopY family transcriptional regulator [Gammaproteobacteria bacterium]|nr:BlaI/MecI/CopY family transcriptional regulator [Pseudomonadales bacterium]MCP5348979.1 BlaI/MecI/CopY family transcriptional regulator [Pseudomonadales bacterium]
MDRKTPLSRSERQLMEIVWDLEEASVAEINDVLNRERPVARNTVRTLLERMREKGWLNIRKQGRSFHYSPTVPREVNLGQRVAEMVDRSCGGSPEKLMMALLHYRGLSDEETARIRSLLDAARDRDES